MPDPQTQAPGSVVDDYVRVKGPDGKSYRFPSGTTKDTAVSYFKTKGIGAAPASATPPVTPPQAQPSGSAPQSSQPRQLQQPEPSHWDKEQQYRQIEANRHRSPQDYSAWVDSVRQGYNKPSPWMPDKIIQDPHWYGRTGKYLAGEFVAAAQTGAGMVSGGSKILYDLARAAIPVPFSQEEGKHPLDTIGEKYSKAGKDISETAKGAYDLGQTIWDYVRHFPEAAADPEKFGKTVMNTAMTIDGAVKLAQSSAGLFKADPAGAAKVANNLSNKAPNRFFERKAFEDAYVHTKGLDVAKKVSTAAREVGKEVEAHAQGISKQIDTAVPSGVIDATDEAVKIITEFKDVIKTPDTAHPVLRQMVDDAQKTAPGQWSWEKTRQFRSSVGRALGKVQGPQKAVMTRVYADLTKKLGDTAKKYNLGDSWNHYNELERKMSHEFADTVDTLRDAQSGQEVAKALGKDKALTGELSKNLSKYGLDHQEVMKYVKDSERILKQQKGWKGSLFRMAYGSPAGVPAMIAVRAAGGGWLPSVAAGALVGYAATGLVNMARALRLSPDVIEAMLDQRALPGKMPVSVGDFPNDSALSAPTNLPGGPAGSPPGGGAPPSTQGGAPQLGQGAPPQLPGISTPQLPAPLSRLTDAAGGESELERLRRNPPQPTQEMSPEAQRAAEVKPKAKTASEAKPPQDAASKRQEAIIELSKTIQTLRDQDKEGSPEYEDAWELRRSLRQERREASSAELDKILGNLKEGVRKIADKHYQETIPLQDKMEKLGEDLKKVTKAAPGEVGREPGARPGTTRESQIGRNTKQAERVAAKRAKAMREKQSEEAEAAHRAQAKDVNVSNLQIPEMEEAVAKMDPVGFKGLQKLRQAKRVSDVDYTEALKYLILRAYEAGGQD